MKPRCVSWVAVSSKAQYERESPEEQRRKNQELIESLGGTLVDVLEVPGESREIVSFEEACDTLEAYAKLRDIIQARRADLIVCQNLSRLARTVALAAAIVKYCHMAGIAIYSRAAPPPTIDAAEQARNESVTLMLAIDSAFSEIELLRLRDRHRVGMSARARDGKRTSKPPFGYMLDPADLHSMKIYPDQAKIVEFIFDAYVERGRSTYWISDAINERWPGTAPRSGHWTSASVGNIIKRAWRYAGYVEYNKQSVTGRPYIRKRGKWEPIISEQTATAALRELERRVNNRRSVMTPVLLSGCLSCASCGRLLVAKGRDKRPSQRSKPDRAYMCRGCGGSFIRESKAMIALRGAISFLTSQANLEELLAIQEGTGKRYERLMEDLESELLKIAERRRRLTSAYSDGIIDPEEYREHMDALRIRQERVRADLETYQSAMDQESPESKRDRLEEIAGAGLKVLDMEDIPAVNTWIRKHFSIYVLGNDIERIEYQ